MTRKYFARIPAYFPRHPAYFARFCREQYRECVALPVLTAPSEAGEAPQEFRINVVRKDQSRAMQKTRAQQGMLIGTSALVLAFFAQ